MMEEQDEQREEDASDEPQADPGLDEAPTSGVPETDDSPVGAPETEDEDDVEPEAGGATDTEGTPDASGG